MIILNAGVPRSGTVLVNAIIRELLCGVAPSIIQANPHGAELGQFLRRVEEKGQHLYATSLIHTHTWGTDVGNRVRGTTHIKAIVNYRDPRDVCVSLMTLHENEFDVTCKAIEQYFALMEACVRDTCALVLPYELMAANPDAAVFQIGRHLGLWPGLDTIARIARATSIDTHRTVMEQVQAGTRKKLAHRKNRKRVLVEDKETLINDRHIQSGSAGRWKTELTVEQQQMATERFAPILRRYGYSDHGGTD